MSTTKRNNCIDCGKPIDVRNERCDACNRKHIAEKIKESPPKSYNFHKYHPCITVGCKNKASQKGKRCWVCYKKSLRTTNYTNLDFVGNRKYTCKNNCGRMTKDYGGLCRVCADAEKLKQGEAQQVKENKRKADNLKRTTERLDSQKVDVCPNRNGLAHYWKLDGNNKGKCQCCPCSKRFSTNT